MTNQALLVEVLLSAFFAIACFRARAEEPSLNGVGAAEIVRSGDGQEGMRRGASVFHLFVAA